MKKLSTFSIDFDFQSRAGTLIGLYPNRCIRWLYNIASASLPLRQTMVVLNIDKSPSSNLLESMWQRYWNQSPNGCNRWNKIIEKLLNCKYNFKLLLDFDKRFNHNASCRMSQSCTEKIPRILNQIHPLEILPAKQINKLVVSKDTYFNIYLLTKSES